MQNLGDVFISILGLHTLKIWVYIMTKAMHKEICIPRENKGKYSYYADRFRLQRNTPKLPKTILPWRIFQSILVRSQHKLFHYRASGHAALRSSITHTNNCYSASGHAALRSSRNQILLPRKRTCCTEIIHNAQKDILLPCKRTCCAE